MAVTSPELNVDAVLGILGPDGPLAKTLKGFESRSEQQAMMRNVLDAYHHNHISLIEAGTGTGKSLAYLIPAMLWAVEAKERTLISTNTINLQEQLIHKDIPLVANALNLNVKAVLVKGMHNYLCLRKLEEIQYELPLYTPQEAEDLRRIDAWKQTTPDGSRSTLPFSPTPGIWDKICAESDTCNRALCPHYQQCHFFKARRQASEAQILVVNHHLLFADLVYRADTGNFQDPAILPSYNRVILDEAHNIEDIATDYFASRFSHMDLMRLTARLSTEKKDNASGKLHILKEKIVKIYRHEFPREVTSLLNRLGTDLPGLRHDLLLQARETFAAYLEFARSMQQSAREESEEHAPESKLRILGHHHTSLGWQEQLVPMTKQLSNSIQRFAQAITSLIFDLKQLSNPQIDEQTKGLTYEITALAERLNTASAILDGFISAIIPTMKVRWIELQKFKTMINTALVDADLDIAKILVERLFSKFSTIVLCSATLTTNNDFQFIRNRLGLTAEQLQPRMITEHIYNSPFDFQKQALLVIPTDLPGPHTSDFIAAASEKIWQCLQASRGNAFVLFTSYAMLSTCFARLQPRMLAHRMHPLKQGDDDRQLLLNKFKSTEHSVLFGTDSFWEGVDVAGEALRCVIIVKLPFKVPSEPIIQARSEAILTKGGDPFMDYSLPQAIVKFKQGFGRLIRNRRDRGCIVCLDNRIVTKNYGQQFLKSLPPCCQVFAGGESMQLQIKDFYRRTHFLTTIQPTP